MNLYRGSECDEVAIFLERVKSFFSDDHSRIGCRLYSWVLFVLVEDDPTRNDSLTVVEPESVGP